MPFREGELEALTGSVFRAAYLNPLWSDPDLNTVARTAES